jgi:hypothetical protein
LDFVRSDAIFAHRSSLFIVVYEGTWSTLTSLTLSLVLFAPYVN